MSDNEQDGNSREGVDSGSAHSGNEKSGRKMNKKLNSVLFILGATVVNVGIMIAMLLLLATLYARFLSGVFGQGGAQVALIVIFFVSVASSYLFYHLFIKWLSKKVDMDKYFDPIFRIGARKR